MNRSFFFTLLVAAALVATAGFLSRTVQAGHHGKRACCHSNAKTCCPKCKTCCKLEAEMVDVEKKCFEVECETICIPKVVFPWQVKHHTKGHRQGSCCDACDGRGCASCNNCVHNGAKVRKIKVLKSKKYTCPECEYTWTAETVPCGPCCGTGNCCDAPMGACDAPAPVYQDEVLPAPVQ